MFARNSSSIPPAPPRRGEITRELRAFALVHCAVIALVFLVVLLKTSIPELVSPGVSKITVESPAPGVYGRTLR